MVWGELNYDFHLRKLRKQWSLVPKEVVKIEGLIGETHWMITLLASEHACLPSRDLVAVHVVP